MQRPGLHLGRGARTTTKGGRGYLRRHYPTLWNHKDKVREVLLTAMNGGLKAGMIHLAQQGVPPPK